MNEVPFQEFKKVPRLSREMVITEKIDGTNGVVYIGEDGVFLTGSRTRWITPEKDNYGFFMWCYQNKEKLMELGVGFHYGEWYGVGIQRGYNLSERRFALFNVHRWADEIVRPKCCEVVPTLYVGDFDTNKIQEILYTLHVNGSVAAPGYLNPEGIVIFHKASGQLFKKTIINDEKPKGK